MVQIIKDGKNFIVETISPVNGKVLSKSRPVSQRVSVFTNINATALELGVRKGTKIKIFDKTNGTVKELVHTVK